MIITTPHRFGRRIARRGAALLIVLAALMVTTTCATILLSAAADVRLQHDRAGLELIAHDVLVSSEAPIQDWLDRDSRKVALGPDILVPAVGVLHDLWIAGAVHEDHRDRVRVELTITAYDQLGMVPARLARSGSPLRRTLPPEALTRLDSINLPPISDSKPLGLDLFVAGSDVDGGLHDPAVFPESLESTAVRFGEAALSGADSEVEHSRPTCPAIGAMIATHNGPPRIRININTAPMPLVEAALRMSGREGLERIIAGRTNGRPASARDSFQSIAEDANDVDHVPRIVTASDCWAFLIDVRVHGFEGAGARLHRSWWAIYSPGPDHPATPHHRERWRCVQRLAVTQ